MTYFSQPNIVVNFNCLTGYRTISLVGVGKCKYTIELYVAIEMAHKWMFCVIISGWVRRAGYGTICAAVVKADSSSHSAEESTARPPRASSRLCVTWSVTQPGKEVIPMSCFTLKSSLLLPKCSINCIYVNDLFTQNLYGTCTGTGTGK